MYNHLVISFKGGAIMFSKDSSINLDKADILIQALPYIQKFNGYIDKNNPSLTFENPREARKHAFKPGNEYAKVIACSRVPAVIIGRFIFVHAGFVDSLIEKLHIKGRNDLYRIGLIMRKWLLGLIDKDNIIDIINTSSHSLLWERILGGIPPNMNSDHPDCVNHLDKALGVFKVEKMIIGHTPQYFINNIGINKTCSDKLWRIDFGGSFGFNKFDKEFTQNGNVVNMRNAQVLKILNDKEITILPTK